MQAESQRAMRKTIIAIAFLFFVCTPVYAGGLEAPQNLRVETARCDMNASDHYILFTWDKVPSATSYDIYGKPVEQEDYTYYGNTTSNQYGPVVRKNIEYVFYVIAKAGDYKSNKSKEYILTIQTVELACRTARENKPWYEMKITSTINAAYRWGDWFSANFDFTYFQPEKKYNDKDFIYKAFLYPAKNSTIRYFEVTIKGYQTKTVSYHLNSIIPTGYYRLRIMLDQPMIDMMGNQNYPFVDSSNEIYIYGNQAVISPSPIVTIPQPEPTKMLSLTPIHDDRSDYQEIKRELNSLKNQTEQVKVQQNILITEINSLKKLVQNIINKIFGGIFPH